MRFLKLMPKAEFIIVGARVELESRFKLEYNIKDALKNKFDEIHILFGSTGGEIYQALEFFKFVSKLDKQDRHKLHIYSAGPVESAAVVVFLSFDKRFILRNSSFMIHTVRQKHNESTDTNFDPCAAKLNQSMLDIIISRTSLKSHDLAFLKNPVDKIKLTPEEAISKGFGKFSQYKFSSAAKQLK